MLRVRDRDAIGGLARFIDGRSAAATLKWRTRVAECLVPGAEEPHRVELLLLDGPRAGVLVIFLQVLVQRLLVGLCQSLALIGNT